MADGNANLTAFFDGCPSDWLIKGQDEDWHTISRDFATQQVFGKNVEL